MTHDDQVRAQSALVTGGSNGIGAALVSLLAARGAHVEVWDRIAPESPVTGVDYRLVDVSTAQEPAGGEEMEPLDLLVNAAGVTGFAAAESLPVETWNDVVHTNLSGPYLVARAMFERLRLARGSVVNITSITAEVPGAHRSAYCASKSGLTMLTRVLALEWAEHGIRVNAVSPGYTRTAMVEEAIAAGHLDEGRILQRTPMHRLASPEEIAEVVLSLCEPRFAHIVGQVVTVDGGWSINGAY